MTTSDPRAALEQLARQWDAESDRRLADKSRENDGANLLAAGINLTHANALRAALADTAPLAPCWFCKQTFVVDALIAGYDTWDESRLACLACNERMDGNWRPAARLAKERDQG